MNALVYHGPGKRAWEAKPRPTITEATDAIVRITTSTICGTDLHILKGDLPSVTDGRILGHEGIGVVEEVGTSVTSFHVGDRVLISCVTACGKCDFCRKSMYSHCRNGGWILGNTIDGTQAEFVRIPHADTSLYPVPANADEEALVMLSDILPTGFECGVLNGQVKPGDTVAIVGAGPIGLAVLLTAQFFSPATIVMIDLDDKRLAVAKQFGATELINSADGKAAERVMALTGGAGVDVAIEAVGVPATFGICQAIVAAGGRIANVGVHGKPVELHLEKLWDRNITLTTRLVDTVTTPMLLKVVQSGKLQPGKLVTHRFALNDVMKAYDTFGNAASEGALKVILFLDCTRATGAWGYGEVMTTPKSADYATRETILQLLSDDEVAKVSTAETAKNLEQGDEFIDLEDIGAGVKTASGAATHMGSVLPRKAVHADTWKKVLSHLSH